MRHFLQPVSGFLKLGMAYRRVFFYTGILLFRHNAKPLWIVIAYLPTPISHRNKRLNFKLYEAKKFKG